MFLLFLFMFHVHADDGCPAPDKYRFGSIEFKLNLDGNSKPEAVARFIATDGDKTFYRRALLFDAPAKIESPKDEEWLEPCQEGGDDPSPVTITYEKVPAGDRDLLFSKQEGGENTIIYQYSTAEDGKPKTALRFFHPSHNGQFNETHDKKKVLVRITGDGELSVDGNKVDLDQLSLKNRCRVRELQIQLKYEWDRKTHKFKEVDQGCVMGSAID